MVYSRLFCRSWQLTLTLAVILVLSSATVPLYSQEKRRLTINEISELLKRGVSPTRIVQLVEEHGVAFELDSRALQRLKQDGVNEAVLSAVKRMSARYVEERQRMKQQQEEAAKQLHAELAKRRELEKIRVEEEKRRQAELSRKKQEEAKQRAEEVRLRQQDEARRKIEEDARRAEEQSRRQAEQEKARAAEELRRQEEARLAEEKRRIEDETRRAEAERRKQQEIQAVQDKEAQVAKNKIREEKRQTETQPRMIDEVKNSYTAAPTYNDGDSWYFNVTESTSVYSNRALKGVYELRYSAKRFQIFSGRQRVTGNDGQIGVLLAMVGQGSYMGGEYLKFPLSVGQKWSHRYESGVRASRAILSWNSEATVKSVETVRTPAGDFRALKIVREEWNHRGGRATFTYYYSPQARSIIKMLWDFSDLSRTVEMIKIGSNQ